LINNIVNLPTVLIRLVIHKYTDLKYIVVVLVKPGVLTRISQKQRLISMKLGWINLISKLLALTINNKLY